MAGDPFQDYRQLLEKIDRFADHLRQLYPHSFACAPGCSSCCVSGIRVWRVEHDHLSAALVSSEAGASPERRVNSPPSKPVMLRRRVAGERAASERASRSEGDAPASDDDCPLLCADGRCRVYDARPVVCRLWGLPILIPSGSEGEWDLRGRTAAAADTGGSVICCDLNFTTPPALADLPQGALISARTVVTTLAAINHVYCREQGLDPEERLPLHPVS